MFTALLVVYFALQGRWRAVAWSIGTMLCGVLVTMPFTGAAAWREDFGVIQSVTWFGNSWNASFASFITRILGGSENVPLVNAPALGQVLMLISSAATLVWMAWITRREPVRAEALTSRTQAARFDLGYGLTLAVMLLVSPLGWMYYFPLLLPGYAVWRLTGDDGRMRRVRWGLLVAWGLSTIPTTMVRAADANDPLGWFTGNSLYFYALDVFAIVLSAALARTDRLRPACSIPGADSILGTGSTD